MKTPSVERVSEELKPCPFCGSDSIDPTQWMDGDHNSGPGCDDCGACAESAEAWNRRAGDEQRRAREGLSEEEREALQTGARFIEYVTDRTDPESSNQVAAIAMDRKHAAILRRLAAKREG